MARITYTESSDPDDPEALSWTGTLEPHTGCRAESFIIRDGVADGVAFVTVETADGRPLDRLWRVGRRAVDEYLSKRREQALLPDAAIGQRFRMKQRERSASGVNTKRDALARADDALLVRVQAVKLAHPTWSARAIAARLVTDVDGDPVSRNRAVNAMRARIRRATDRRK